MSISDIVDDSESRGFIERASAVVFDFAKDHKLVALTMAKAAPSLLATSIAYFGLLHVIPGISQADLSAHSSMFETVMAAGIFTSTTAAVDKSLESVVVPSVQYVSHKDQYPDISLREFVFGRETGRPGLKFQLASVVYDVSMATMMLSLLIKQGADPVLAAFVHGKMSLPVSVPVTLFFNNYFVENPGEDVVKGHGSKLWYAVHETRRQMGEGLSRMKSFATGVGNAAHFNGKLILLDAEIYASEGIRTLKAAYNTSAKFARNSAYLLTSTPK